MFLIKDAANCASYTVSYAKKNPANPLAIGVIAAAAAKALSKVSIVYAVLIGFITYAGVRYYQIKKDKNELEEMLTASSKQPAGTSCAEHTQSVTKQREEELRKEK